MVLERRPRADLRRAGRGRRADGAPNADLLGGGLMAPVDWLVAPIGGPADGRPVCCRLQCVLGVPCARRCMRWLRGRRRRQVSSEMCSQQGTRGWVEGRLRAAGERGRCWSREAPDAVGCGVQDPIWSLQARRREAWWWPCTAVARLLCRGCAVQWRHGSTSACCVGVAAPGESLAGAGRPAATAPVGVAILLGGVVGNHTAKSPGSSPSGENPDPAAGSGGGVVFNVVPLFRALS